MTTNCIHDSRIDADNYSLVMTMGEYYDLVKDCLDDNEYQRKRVRNSSSFYSLLKKDLIRGCIMPPIVLALCEPLPFDCDIRDIIKTYRSKIKILDGLQRSYTIKEIVKEYNNSLWHEGDPLNNKMRVEIYVGIDKLGILYRMLTLNAGQTPMSARHQIEIIYSDYKESCDIPGVRFLTEAEGGIPTDLGEYKFRDVVEGFTSFLQSDYLTLDRREILENARDLERIASFAADKNLFYNFVDVYHHFVFKLNSIDNYERLAVDLEQRCDLAAAPYATSFMKMFNKSQSLTGFGCALAVMKDNGKFNDLNDLHQEIESIDTANVSCGFDAAIGILDWIRKNAKKIGNDQREYFYLFFLSFFDNDSATRLNFKESVDRAFKHYKSGNNANQLF